jgi:hypothetical protein
MLIEIELGYMNAKNIRITVSLLILLLWLLMRYEGIKYTVNSAGKYDYVLLTESIYPIRYQLVLIDNYIRKQYYFIEKNNQITCEEFINAEVRVSTNEDPLQGFFVKPVCFHQFDVNANVLIGDGKNKVAIHLSSGGQINELRNPRLFVRAEKFEKSYAYSILKYIHNIFMPLAVIVLVIDIIAFLRLYLKK